MKEQQNQTWKFKMFIRNIGETDLFFLKIQLDDIHKKESLIHTWKNFQLNLYKSIS